MVSADGIYVDSQKVERVKKKLGATNYGDRSAEFPRISGVLPQIHRRVFKDSRTTALLTRKGVKFEWTDRCEESFQTLKEKLMSAPVLTFPEGNKGFEVYSNASHQGLGCVLMQHKRVSVCFQTVEETRAELPYS